MYLLSMAVEVVSCSSKQTSARKITTEYRSPPVLPQSRRKWGGDGVGGGGGRGVGGGDGRGVAESRRLGSWLVGLFLGLRDVQTRISGNGFAWASVRNSKRMLFVGCLTSQQHASVSQGRTCTDNFTCCHNEIEVADRTFYLTQSQYTNTGPTSPSADPITPGAWQGSHWSANF